MRQSYRILPVYTGDVSGVCSALYELGGMVVMHDPSGCNSTYNTHDEIRWYDQDSLIFLSGLRMEDAIMGGDDKFIDDVTQAALLYRPAFIALCNSPIPYLNGTDFDGICRLIRQNTGIPTFCVPTNGMYDYARGAGLALEALAVSLFDCQEEMFRGEAADSNRPQEKQRSVNILGMTPLDFAAQTCRDSICAFVSQHGWHVQSVWAMGDALPALMTAPAADLNLVVSSAGLPAAKYLYSRFGIPWVAGLPVGAFADVLAAQMERGVKEHCCGPAYTEAVRNGRSRPASSREAVAADSGLFTAVVGEAVLSGSILAALRLEGQDGCAVITAGTHIPSSISPLCYDHQADESSDTERFMLCLGEEETEEALLVLSQRSGERGLTLRIAADPMYSLIAPGGARVTGIPQLAFSGRVYRKQFRDLCDSRIWRKLWD